MDNNTQQMPKGGIRKTLEEMLNEYEIRIWDGKFPLIRQEAAAELMENYAYQELTEIRAERDAYAIDFAEWAASQLWELYPECEEDEEQLWYRRSYDKDEPDEKVTSSQLLELFKNQHQQTKQ